MRFFITRLLVLLALLAATGCNQNPPTAPVTGVVMYHGKPLTHGSIMFQPKAGPPGRSVIAPDGTFELWTFEPGDGALLGKHRVRVACFDESKQVDTTQNELSTGRTLIPPWYQSMESSGLEYTVEEKPEGEANTFEIVLSDKRPST